MALPAEIVFVCSPGDREREALGLRPILGVPLFVRSCLTLRDQGYRRFAILVPAALCRQVTRLWQRYALGRDVHLDVIPLGPQRGEQPAAQRVLPSLAALQQVVAERFAILDAGTVVTAAWVKSALRPGLAYHRPIVGAIGVLQRDRLSTEIVSTVAFAADDSGTAEEPGRYCRITSVAQIPRMEHFLCENIRHSANGLIAKHVNKRISLPISRVLARLRISPNAITVFNMLIGLAAGIGTAGVTYVGLLSGGILFQLASILDGCDGEVAKLTHRTSRFGQIIDTVSDNFALASFFIGLTIHQYRVTESPLAFLWSAALFSGFGTMLVILLRFLRRFTNSASLATFDREYAEPLMRHLPAPVAALLRLGKALLKKEWFSLVFLMMAMIGMLPWALYIATVSSWVGVLGVLWLQRLPQLHAAKAPTALPTGAALQERAHG